MCLKKKFGVFKTEKYNPVLISIYRVKYFQLYNIYWEALDMRKKFWVFNTVNFDKDLIYGKYKCSKDVRKDQLQAFKTKKLFRTSTFYFSKWFKERKWKVYENFRIIVKDVDYRITWYSWNIDQVGIIHQSINQSISESFYCDVHWKCLELKLFYFSKWFKKVENVHVFKFFELTGLYTVKVRLFVGTNFRGFYKMHWSSGFLNPWFQLLQETINGKIVFRWILIFVV